MPRKIFISILGTGYYHKTRYYFGSEPVGNENESRFIQEATMDYLCSNWTLKDKAYIFVTKGKGGSKERNWKKNAQENHRDGEYKGLSIIIKDRKFEFDTEDVEIPDGFNNDEIWKIFELVFSKLEKGDEVYFDITHSFRSIPMLVMVLINYAKLLKNIKVKGIYYGAFEKLGPAYEVKNIPIENRFAPVIDLTSFSELQDWTNAANLFVNHGATEMMSELINHEEIKSNLNLFSNIHSTARGKDLFSGEIADVLRKQFEKIDFNISPFNPIKDRINDKLSEYEKGDIIKNGLSAIKYCMDFNLTQQGITILAEFIITYLLIYIKEDWENEYNRSTVSGCMNIKKQSNYDFTMLSSKLTKLVANGKIKESEKKVLEEKESSIVSKIFELSFRKKISDKVYKKLSQGSRNDINHAGIRQDPKTAEYLKDRLSKYYLLTKEIIESNTI